MQATSSAPIEELTFQGTVGFSTFPLVYDRISDAGGKG